MNDKRTSRIVLHVPQEEMVRLAQAARALKVSVARLRIDEAALERAKRVLKREFN